MDEPAYWHDDGVTAPATVPMPSWCRSGRSGKQYCRTHAMSGITCKRLETVHEVDVSQWVKRAPKEMDEPGY